MFVLPNGGDISGPDFQIELWHGDGCDRIIVVPVDLFQLQLFEGRPHNNVKELEKSQVKI